MRSAPQLETLAGRGHTVLRQDGRGRNGAGELGTRWMRSSSLAGARPGAAREDGTGGGVRGANDGGDCERGAAGPRRGDAAGAGEGRRGRAEGGRQDEQRATAERAVYDGETDRLTLGGGVQLTDAGSELWASQVELDHKTGDSEATGAVKATYVQPAGRGSDGRGRRAGGADPHPR